MYFYLAAIFAASQSAFDSKSNQIIDLFPVFLNRHGAQCLPFDLFDGFPAFSIKLHIEIGIHRLIIAPANASNSTRHNAPAVGAGEELRLETTLAEKLGFHG